MVAAVPMGSDGKVLESLLAEVQGNIVRAYGSQYCAVRHLVLRVVDRDVARRALGIMVDGDRATPDVTPAHRHPSEADFRWCLNVGFTHTGLKALGVPERSLKSFPEDFKAGMVSRAPRLGDIGDSAPSKWVGGLGDPGNVHLIVTIHGCTPQDIEPIAEQVLNAESGRAFTLVSGDRIEGEVICDPTTNRRLIHFGYADGISQPRFVGIHDPESYPDRLPFAPLGAVLLGYPSAIPHVSWKVPSPNVLGRNGSFNAFRILSQDVTAFDAFLDHVVTHHAGPDEVSGITAELVAAKLCGRWRSGVPLALAPTDEARDAFDEATKAAAASAGADATAEARAKGADPATAAAAGASAAEMAVRARLNDFDYVGGEGGADVAPDPDGLACPIGAHIRRTNPRSAHIVQRSSNRTRALIRRGIPYGPPWVRGEPETPAVDRGLLGNFICGSLAAQFEAMQYDWVNLGLQDPRITGTNDPLIGVNEPATSSFSWPLGSPKKPMVIPEIPRFVTTRGGAYTFLASIPAIRWIATQPE